MSDADIRTRILQVLQRIAPEARQITLDSAAPLRDQLDLDSMDVLNFMIGLHREFGVDIPESDYARLATLDDITRVLSTYASSKPAGSPATG